MVSISHGSGSTIRSSLPVIWRCLTAKARPMLTTLFSDPMKTKRQSGGTTDTMCSICGTSCGSGRGSMMSATLVLS